jgi:hypothetical protein
LILHSSQLHLFHFHTSLQSGVNNHDLVHELSLLPTLVTLPYPTKDFTGQTIIVTGANTGLEFEAAKHFIRLHASKAILAVRSLEKGRVAKKTPFSLLTQVLMKQQSKSGL